MPASWMRIVSACVVFGLSAPPAHAARITEFLATNASTNTDEDGEFSDWLELHNEGGAPVDLTGYYLTDDATLLTKWQLPSVTLPAGGYLLVWASDKNRTTPGAPLHTNFRLSAGGEYLGLVRPDGTTIEHEYAPQFPPQIVDVSYGLASDLSTQRCFLTPTPAAPNDESVACGFTADVQFNVPHGMYDAPFNLTLTTLTPGATIRYTLNGTAPSPTVGTVYAGPIAISTTTPVRALATAPDLAPSKSSTQTYVFLDDVVQQSAATLPPGYPSTWGSGASADYDMDPDVVNDPLYAPTIRDDLKSIPTLSIVTDLDHLFGPTNGIYTHPEGRGDAWERPASVEMIFPDGSDAGFQKNGGIRIQGQTSRTPSVRKHSLSLRFRSDYDGPLSFGFFDTAVIQDAPTDSFSEIRLFAGHQNTWHSSFGGTPARAQYLREIYARDALSDMGQRSSHGISVHLYLNGIYWGMYQAAENPDADFFATYFGGTDDDYDVFKDNDLEDGDSVALDALRALLLADLTSLPNYQALLQYLDVESLADYVLMNFYIANTDWSAHNWIIGRKREPGAGFKFFAWDSELSLGGATQVNLDVNGPLGIYGHVLASPEFKLLLADHVRRHFFDGGALTPNRAAARFLKRSQEIDRAVVGESARWGDKLRPTQPYTRDNEWLVEKFRLLLEFFPARTEVVLNQLKIRGLYPSTGAPAFNQLGGSFFPGFQLAITAPAGTIYYTTDGSDPRLPGGAVSPGALAYAGPLTLSTSVHVAARVLAGSSWSALTEASFVRETAIRITELMYNATGGSNFDFLELKNVGPSAVDLVGLRFTVGIDFIFPSFVVAPGAHALIVKSQASFDTLYGAGKPVVGVYAGNLSDGGEQLRLEDADGNAIHDFTYADSWYPTTDGGGYSLVIRDPLADESAWGLASGWRASTFVNGSAGAMEVPLCGDGADNDGDTLVDLADPGCAGASQDSESPECNDGADNDGDTAVDLADPECAAASDASESPAPDDGSLCYKVRPFAAGPTFAHLDATLSDEFESGVRFTLFRSLALCLAGALNGSPVHDGATHLESYKIREAPGQPQHVRRTGLEIESLLGPLTIDTVRPDRLLVPTANDTGGPVTAPNPAAHEVDHYKCYKMKVTKGTPKYFPKAARANFADDFEHRDYAVKSPKLFCTPVDVDGGGIENPAGYLLCYSAKQGTFDPPHTRRVGVYTANGFGDERLDTVREEHLCVPTRLVSP